MIEKLSIDEILKILKKTPEQALFDWKSDFKLPRTEDEKSELVKDVLAISNGTYIGRSGHIFYGVAPDRPDPILGVTENGYDDASLQQLLTGRVDPIINCCLYDVRVEDGRRVMVLAVPPSIRFPHLVVQNFGKLREGQILIRVGSSTRGINHNELIRMVFGPTSPYLNAVLQKRGIVVQEQQNFIETQKLLMQQEERTRQSIGEMFGF